MDPGTERLWGACQSQGGRDYQEDEIGAFSDPNYDLLIVADGMGGHANGALASNLVVRGYVEHFPDAEGTLPERLLTCLEVGNQQIAAAVEQDPASAGMGSTLLAVVIDADGVRWLSVGDSPLWLYREGALDRLNEDHSMAAVFQAMVDAGRMTAAEAAREPGRHLLRSAVSGESIELIDQRDEPLVLGPADKLIAASDGIQTLEEAEIAACIAELPGSTDEEIAERLVARVIEAGRLNQDNVSVVVYTPSPPSESVSEPVTTPPASKSPSTESSFRNLVPLWTVALVVVMALFIAVGVITGTGTPAAPQTPAEELIDEPIDSGPPAETEALPAPPVITTT